LNLLTQGVDPALDLSHIDEARTIARNATSSPSIHWHPYAGELVYTAFSGSHQDAIKKGWMRRSGPDRRYVDVPYLSIDPKDVGRATRRSSAVNSQSGKGASRT